MIRVAAVGDLHVGVDSAELWRAGFARLPDEADLLLLAGDLTRCGSREEADEVARVLAGLAVPVVAVLGNHDYHADRPRELARVLESVGVHVLEGSSAVFAIGSRRVGVAGTKGFGGGFAGACGGEFGEPQMKAFVGHTRSLAETLGKELASLDTDVRLALLHYSPVEATLQGERLEIYPFLGSYLLAEAVDRAGADLVVHGHAHAGSPKGLTAGGIRVRNVAQPVIKRAYHVFCFSERDSD